MGKDKTYRVFEIKEDKDILLYENLNKVSVVDFILSNYSRDTLENGKAHVKIVRGDEEKSKWDSAYSSVDYLVNMAIPAILLENKGFVLPYLDKKNTRVIEIDKKNLKNIYVSKLIEEAKKIGLLNLKIPASETKNIGEIEINNLSISEFLQTKNFEKSKNKDMHYSAMFRLEEIVKSSILVEVHPDRNKKNGKRLIENGINWDVIVLRAYGAVKLKNEEKIYSAKITLKQYINFKRENHKLYTYEIIDAKLNELKREKNKSNHDSWASLSLESATPPLPPDDSISLANLLKDFNKECEEGKNILEASEKSEKLLIEPGNNILKEYLRQNNFLDRETQEKIVNDKGTHITTNVDTRLDSEIETIKDKLESLHEDQEESNTKSVRRRR